MNLISRYFLISILFLSFNISSSFSQERKQKLVSRIVTNSEGKTYLEVDGSPFLYNSVQSWFPPGADYEIYMQKTAELNYRIFCFWLLWPQLEPVEGEFDWTAIDKVIDMANKYDVRLDIVWGGSSFCGAMDPRFVPEWFMKRDDLKVKNDYGEPVLTPQGDVGLWPHADYRNPEVYELEKRMIVALMNHIYDYDSNHRVVFFQVENEVNLPGSNSMGHEWSLLHDKELVLSYCDKIGKLIKESPYKIATRINFSGKSYYPEADELEYIDCQGPDIYSDDIEVVRKYIKMNKKFAHIAENAAYRNSSSLITAALAAGGFYNIYRLDYDEVWKKPGLWGDNWGYLKRDGAVTYDVQALNGALNKISEIITTAPSSDFLEFNTEKSMPEWKYDEVKEFNGIHFGMKSTSSTRSGEPVGFIVKEKGSYFLIADKPVIFSFDKKPRKIQSGSMNEKGNWVKKYDIETMQVKDGSYQVYYDYFDCIKVEF